MYTYKNDPTGITYRQRRLARLAAEDRTPWTFREVIEAIAAIAVIVAIIVLLVMVMSIGN